MQEKSKNVKRFFLQNIVKYVSIYKIRFKVF